MQDTRARSLVQATCLCDDELAILLVVCRHSMHNTCMAAQKRALTPREGGAWMLTGAQRTCAWCAARRTQFSERLLPMGLCRRRWGLWANDSCPDCHCKQEAQGADVGRSYAETSCWGAAVHLCYAHHSAAVVAPGTLPLYGQDGTLVASAEGRRRGKETLMDGCVRVPCHIIEHRIPLPGRARARFYAASHCKWLRALCSWLQRVCVPVLRRTGCRRSYRHTL